MAHETYDLALREHSDMAVAATDLTRTIATPEQYRTACDYLLRVKERRKWWGNTIGPAIKAAWDSYKKIKDVEKTVDAPLLAAEEQILKPAILTWESKDELRRKQEQDRLSEELKSAEEDRRLHEAAALEKAGFKEQAQAVINAPVEMPTVIVPKESVKGVNTRTIYSAEVFDIKALCRAVANGDVPHEYILPNTSALNSLARSLKESMNAQWEKFGVRAKSEKTVAVGGR